jgi:hypothetical protein
LDLHSGQHWYRSEGLVYFAIPSTFAFNLLSRGLVLHRYRISILLLLSHCFRMLSQFIFLLCAIPPATTGADNESGTSLRLAGLDRRHTEVDIAAATPVILPEPPVPSTTTVIQGATLLAVAPPPALPTSQTESIRSQSETPLVFEPPETPTVTPAPTPSAADLESVLFGPPPTASPETTSAPWTLPIALPPESQSPPAPLATHKPVKGPIVAAYYPDWAEQQLTPENVDFSRFDWVDFGTHIPAIEYCFN